MIRMEVSGVYTSSRSAYPQVVLREMDGSAFLPIVIGRFEAAAISMAYGAHKHQPARPISYDLAQAILETVGARVDKVEITHLREGTYYAVVHLRGASGAVHMMDSRPSDAIALALRMGAPIFASRKVLQEAGYVGPDERDSGEAGEKAAPLGRPLQGHPRSQSLQPGITESVARPEPARVPANTPEKLRQRLEEAVALEEYELAARLRDEIRRLEHGSAC